MSDGTEAPPEGEATQTEEALAETLGADAQGASELGTDAALPEGVDKHLAKALKMLPEEIREEFSDWETDKLLKVRDYLLRGADYHKKRREESAELREAKAKAQQFEQAAQYWNDALNDPEHAIRILSAHAGKTVEPTSPQETFDPLQLFEASDPEEFKRLWNLGQQQMEQKLRTKLTQEMQSQPMFRQRALEERLTQIRTGLGDKITNEGWDNAMKALGRSLRSRGVDPAGVDPGVIEMMLEPVLDYEMQRAEVDPVAGLKPPSLTGAQATSVSGSGVAGGRVEVPIPKGKTFQERMAYTLKTTGVGSLTNLRRLQEQG